MIRAELHRNEMCPGVRGCPEARSVACRDCGILFDPADIRRPHPCPECGSRRYKREACADCALVKLETAKGESLAGVLLKRVLLIDAALQMRFHLTLADITYEEFSGLCALYSERTKKQIEDAKRMEQQAKMGQRSHGR